MNQNGSLPLRKLKFLETLLSKFYCLSSSPTHTHTIASKDEMKPSYDEFMCDNLLKNTRSADGRSDSEMSCENNKSPKTLESYKSDNSSKNREQNSDEDDGEEDDESESEIDLTTTASATASSTSVNGSSKHFVYVNGCIDFSNNNNNHSSNSDK